MAKKKDNTKDVKDGLAQEVVVALLA